jgi:hypothetical protein
MSEVVHHKLMLSLIVKRMFPAIPLAIVLRIDILQP